MASAYSFSAVNGKKQQRSGRRGKRSIDGLSTASKTPDLRENGPAVPDQAAAPAANLLVAAKSATNDADASRRSRTGYVWPLGVTAAPAEAVEICAAGAGDHPATYQLLNAVFQSPTRDEFSATLEDPFYEPRDRLVVRQGTLVSAHVHVAHRVMHFGDMSFPVSTLQRLAVLPECRGRNYGRRLLAKADEAMRAEGSVFGALTTRIPHFFRRADWVVGMRQSRAQVGARHLLAQLSARGVAAQAVGDAVNVRPWRHVELPSLIRLYQGNSAGAYGTYERTDAYWRWLVSRFGSEGIFVARTGPRRFDLDFDDGTIVGYVIQKDDRIIELVAAPKNPGVKERLLARALGEAIERDHHDVRIDLAPDDPIWNSVERAGGAVYRGDSCQGEVTMVKLFDQRGFLERLLPAVEQRADAAGLKRPAELGLIVGDQLRLQISLGRRGASIGEEIRTKARLRLSSADFTRMLLGHYDVGQVLAEGRIKASSEAAAKIAAALFPRLPLRHPPLDELLVQ